MAQYIRWFKDLRVEDVPLVGGKNASLGEMIYALAEEKIPVPEGFATTAEAYYAFLEYNGLRKKTLKTNGMRAAIKKGTFPKDLEGEVLAAYRKLPGKNPDVAVRSSATAEDLPEASFAGQQESFLNVVGEKALLKAVRDCFASLFTDRAISYREEKGFRHDQVALSCGVQLMVRSDKGSSGVMFSIDTETGFPDMVVIDAAYGLGENVVQGTIEPDAYMVYKPLLKNEKYTPIAEKFLGSKALTMVYAKSGTKNIKTIPKKAEQFVLSDSEILQLGKWAVVIEKHYKKPMDIEWAKDGRTKKLFIVQARPETVQSQKKESIFKSYAIKKKGTKLVEGLAIGDAIVSAPVQVIRSVSKIKEFKPGSILVTEMTSPDWVPIMKKASGIITDHGGRTSHAAIVSRELGLPAIVGTQNGTKKLKNGQIITLSCAEGDTGFIYSGKVPFEEKQIDISKLPKIKTDIMLNLANPHEALRWWQLPVKGVGLARMEFIISNQIKIHPMALVHFNKIVEAKVRKQINDLTKGYKNKKEYFIQHLATGIAKIASSVYPHPVIVRMSDFKTNEYAGLIGGSGFEPHEENPMLGFRGASRYYSPRYRDGFALECAAIKRVREQMGFTNVLVMIPFCRTLEEADKVLNVLNEEGLKRGEDGLEVYVMCEIPSNVILADEFAKRFDGFSIGSNDLTQLVLGVDRDSEELAPIFDERNAAVKEMIKMMIHSAKKAKRKIGICGQAPSDYPDFAAFLVKEGINSLSLNPDSVIGVIQSLSNKS